MIKDCCRRFQRLPVQLIDVGWHQSDVVTAGGHVRRQCYLLLSELESSRDIRFPRRCRLPFPLYPCPAFFSPPLPPFPSPPKSSYEYEEHFKLPQRWAEADTGRQYIFVITRTFSVTDIFTLPVFSRSFGIKEL